MENNILDMELSEVEAQKLAEELQTWKESMAAKLEEEAEEKIQAKIDELDEKNNAWREEVAEAYSEKFLAALDEMREDVRAEVLAESVETDPTHKVMEEVLRLVAPLMNEEYTENTYMGEIKRLADKVAEYEKKEQLDEGAAVLEELIEGYDDAFKPALRAIIGEGTPEEVTAKFESIIESLSEADNGDDDADDDSDDEEDLDFDFDDDDDDDTEEVEEEGVNEEELSSILEEFEDDQDGPKVKRSVLRESMMKLYK